MTVIVPEFEDGEYYLQNQSTNRYADIEGPTNDSGAIIHQWNLHGYASQQWEFTLLTDARTGYMDNGIFIHISQ